MKLSTISLKSLLRFSQFYFVLAYFVILFLFSGAAIYGGMIIYAMYQQYQSNRQEVVELQSVVERVTSNKILVEEHIDEYLKTLDQLIPETETYFAVVSSLEKLSSETGIHIDSYNIDASVGNAKKITLQVQIDGTEDQLKRFLDSYHYLGGRLITCEKMSTSTSQKNKVIVLLNFYHEVIANKSTSTVRKISSKDTELIEEIRRSMNP